MGQTGRSNNSKQSNSFFPDLPMTEISKIFPIVQKNFPQEETLLIKNIIHHIYIVLCLPLFSKLVCSLNLLGGLFHIAKIQYV